MTNLNRFGYLFYSVLIVLCFVFQQFGPNFHVSAGSVGLLLLVFGYFRYTDKANFVFAFSFVVVSSFSFLWVLVRYGYSDDLARFARFEVCLFLLLALFRRDFYLPRFNPIIIIIPAIFICVFLLYQVLLDKTFQIPSRYYAMGENLGDGGSIGVYDFYADKLRGNGIYSEPSYFGMVCVVLYSALLRFGGGLPRFASLFIFVVVLLSGSGLGIVGVIVVTLLDFISRGLDMKRLSVMLLTFIGFLILLIPVVNYLSGQYELTFYERFIDSSSSSDASAVTRFINPYYIVLESIGNGDVLGVPVNTYVHYLYTNLYSELGDYPGHNGLWSLVFQFGLTGILLIATLFSRCLNIREFFIVVLICSQNGNVLSYEKVFSIVFAVMLLRGIDLAGESNGENGK